MNENMRDALDWLNEIITNPKGWHRFYSDSETKTCAEAAISLLKEQDSVEYALDVLRRNGWKDDSYGDLLKEQEAVEPWLSYDGKEYIFHCSNCDYEIYHNGDSREEKAASKYAKFCRHCGRAVKWE